MKEALKLALEALETERDIYREHDEDGAPEYIIEAITAIKAALAQPVQEPWCMEMNDCKTKCEDCPDEPAQQKAVAVTYKEVADAMNSLWNGTLEQHQIAEQMANKKLYTTPQQRPWVGLTDEDQFNLVHAMNKNDWHAIQMMDAIEAKLKEKNT